MLMVCETPLPLTVRETRLTFPKDWYARLFEEIIYSLEIEDSLDSHTRQFGYKKSNFVGVQLGERGPQNHLWTAAARVAA